MNYSFTATIYKVGINPCVAVPLKITRKMTAAKGYIPVKGEINGYPFTQTLVPVKNAEYRLFVNGLMLKGSDTKVGDTVRFTIEQNAEPPTAANIKMPAAFRKQLKEYDLTKAFKVLTPYRQKEILRYLNYLKTEEALQRNIKKIIIQLKQ
ncbi:MAG: YdeI/OmpD-associated family protein [Ferruginibacter sp.]